MELKGNLSKAFLQTSIRIFCFINELIENHHDNTATKNATELQLQKA